MTPLAQLIRIPLLLLAYVLLAAGDAIYSAAHRLPGVKRVAQAYGREG